MDAPTSAADGTEVLRTYEHPGSTETPVQRVWYEHNLLCCGLIKHTTTTIPYTRNADCGDQCWAGRLCGGKLLTLRHSVRSEAPPELPYGPPEGEAIPIPLLQTFLGSLTLSTLNPTIRNK